MTIYLLNDDAFICLAGNYYLCIGTKAEVVGAAPEKINKLVQEALAFQRYQSLGAMEKRH